MDRKHLAYIVFAVPGAVLGLLLALFVYQQDQGVFYDCLFYIPPLIIAFLSIFSSREQTVTGICAACFGYILLFYPLTWAGL